MKTNESLKLTQKGGRKKWGGLTRSSVAPVFLGSLAQSLGSLIKPKEIPHDETDFQICLVDPDCCDAVSAWTKLLVHFCSRRIMGLTYANMM